MFKGRTWFSFCAASSIKEKSSLPYLFVGSVLFYALPLHSSINKEEELLITRSVDIINITASVIKDRRPEAETTALSYEYDDITKLGYWPPQRSSEDPLVKVPFSKDEAFKEKQVSQEDGGGLRVTKTEAWPYRVHGHLQMTFNKDNKNSTYPRASGVLIGPCHVLTAGHNLYNPAKKEWASEIIFTPACNESHTPFGKIKACKLLSFAGWVDKGDDAYDLGLIILDKDIGNEIGWSGLLSGPDVLFDSREVSIIGYPGNQGKGPDQTTQMWMHSDKIEMYMKERDKIGKQFIYDITTTEGLSGSAIFDEEGPFTVGIHTKEKDGKGIRINEAKFNRIMGDWLKVERKTGLLTSSFNPANSLIQIIPTQYADYPTRADKGEWQVAYDLGRLYYEGKEFPIDEQQAFYWLRKAVEGGIGNSTNPTYADALTLLGHCYEEGSGVTKNYHQALILYDKAIKLNPRNAEAHCRLGVCYLEGQGGLKKEKEAVVLFKKVLDNTQTSAKEETIAKARHHLGRCYEEGRSVSKNQSKAETLYQQAREKGWSLPSMSIEGRSWIPVKGAVCIAPNLPSLPAHFVESFPPGSQESYLKRLWKELQQHQTAIVSSSLKQTSIAGMGGIGKTTLALAYAYEALDHKAYDYIYWLSSETEDKLMEGYKGLLQFLGVPLRGDEIAPTLYQLIKTHVPQKGKGLLIYDNVPNPNFLDDRNPLSNVHILKTSRCSLGWKNDPISLDVFSPEYSIKYLLERLDLDKTDDNKTKAFALADTLGHLPLALAHAASYIATRKNQGDTLETYLNKFNQQPGPTLTIKAHPFDKTPKVSYEYLIAGTYKIAEEVISERAKTLMKYFAYLDPDSIVVDAFLEQSRKEEDLNEILLELSAFSLIKQAQKFISIHRLVQSVIREELEKRENLPQLSYAISNILTNFSAYLQRMDNNTQESNVNTLVQFYWPSTSHRANLVKLFEHLDRFQQENKLEQNHVISFKVSCISLYDIHNSILDIFRNTIFAALSNTDPGKWDSLYVAQDWDVSNNNAKSIRHSGPRFKKRADLRWEECEAAGLKLSPDIAETVFSIIPFHLEARDRQVTIEALTEVDMTDFKEVAEVINALIAPEISGYERAKVIKELAAKKSPEWQEIREIIKPLLMFEISGYTRSMLIATLIAIKPFERLSVIESVKSLLASGVRNFALARVIKTLTKLKIDERQTFIDNIKPLLILKTNSDELTKVFEVLAKLKPPERKAFIESLTSSPILNMDEDDWPWLISELARMKPLDRQTAIERLKSLLAPKMKEYEWSWKITYLAEMNPFEWKTFTESISLLLTSAMDGSDRARVFETLKKIAPFERQRYAEDIKHLLVTEMSGSARARMIEKLATIKPSERQEITESITPLLAPDMDGYSLEENIEILIKMKPSERKKFVESIKLLLVAEMKGWDRTQIIKALAYINPSERQEIAESVNTLLMPETEGYGRVHLIETLATIKSSERPAFLEITKPLLNFGMEEYVRRRLIQILAKLKSSEWGAFAEISKLLLIPELAGAECAMMIEKLATINSPMQLAFAKSAKVLLTLKMNAIDRIRMIEALAKMDARELQTFTDIVEPLLVHNMTESGQVHLIEILAGLKASERQVFAKSIKPLLIINMDEYNSVSMISKLAKVDASGWQGIAEMVPALLTSDMHEYEKQQVIELLAAKEPSIRQAFVDSIKPLLIPDMGKIDKERVMSGGWQMIEKLAKIKHSELQMFTECVRSLLMPDMNGYERHELVWELKDMETSDRQVFVDNIKFLLTLKMRGSGLAEIIRTLARLEVSELKAAIESIKPLITSELDIYNKALIINALIKIEPEHRINFYKNSVLLKDYLLKDGKWLVGLLNFMLKKWGVYSFAKILSNIQDYNKIENVFMKLKYRD